MKDKMLEWDLSALFHDEALQILQDKSNKFKF